MPNYDRALWADGSKPNSNNPNPLVWKGKTYTDIDSYRRAIEASGASGVAKSDPIGEAAIFGGAAYAVKNPMHVLEMVGAVSTDAKNFSDIQQDLLSRKGTLNPVRKVKNIGRGLKRVGNVIGDIVNPRQVEVAGAPGLRINARDVGNPYVMQIDQSMSPGPGQTRFNPSVTEEAVTNLQKSWNVTGKEGKALVESEFNKWLELELKKVGGDPKKVNRHLFAPGGIIRDGKPQGITGLKKGKPTLYNLGPLEARAYQLNPSNFPEVEKVFTTGHKEWYRSGGTKGLNPAITFEAFKKEAIRTANLEDKLTARLTKGWNLKEPTKGMVGNIPINIDGKTAEIRRALEINKGHMKSAGLRGTDMGMSQLVELAAYNKSMGKIDSFDRRVMDVLGLPSAGKSIPKNFNPKSAQVAAKLAQREQYGWIQAATQFAADSKVNTKLVKGKLKQTHELVDSRDAILGMAEKLALQKTRLNKPIKRKGVFAQATGGQEAAAQAAVARRQLIDEYFKAGFADDDNGLEILKQLLEKTSTEEQVKKALYISPEGQLARFGKKNPMARAEELKIQETWGTTVQTGKATQVKRAFGLPSDRGKLTILPSKATGFPTGATKDDILKIRLEELKKHFDKTGSIQ